MSSSDRGLGPTGEEASDRHGIMRVMEALTDKSTAKPTAVLESNARRPSRLSDRGSDTRRKTAVEKIRNACWTFSKFVGPGFMIAVAYSE